MKFKKLLFITNFFIILFVFFTSCAQFDLLNNNSAKKKLTYIGSFGENIFNNNSDLQQIEISYEGTIFIRDSATASDALRLNSKIHVFNSDQQYQGFFKDKNGKEVEAAYIFIDRSNVLHTLSPAASGPQVMHRIYDLKGNLISELLLAVSNDFLRVAMSNSKGTEAIDSQKNIFFIRTHMASSTMSQFNKIAISKINKELTTVIKSLEINDIIKWIPNYEEGHDMVFNGIQVDNNDKIYITVDKTHGDGQWDGILILDNDLNFIKYLGGNWLFNGPHDIVFDDENFMYVTNLYNDNVKVFNKDLSYIANTSENDEGGKLNGKMKNPTKLKIYKNNIFVIDSGNKRINMYELLNESKSKPQPEPTPTPNYSPSGSSNNPPVINSIDSQVFHNYDTDGNYMGSIYTLIADATDKDGDSLTYSWSVTFTGIGGGNLSRNTGISTTLQTDSFGMGTVTLKVSDGKGGEVTYPFQFSPPK